jgi:glycosyltransferase involved in cell wall biosynthesis
MAGAKTIVHIHGSRFDSFMEGNFLWRGLIRFYLKNVDKVLVMSDAWEQRITAFTGFKNVHIVYNPVSLAARTQTPKENLNILFLGRLGQRKGVYDLLSCIESNKEYFRRGKARFILAGDGEIEKVRQFIREHDLKDLVEVPGWLISEQKEKYLKTSDILILPSYNEHIQMSILEGMGYGYPILATNIAGIPEMVKHGENGFLFEPGDTQTMMFFIKNLFEDAQLRERMGQRSWHLAKEKFQNSKIVDQLVSIYEGL